jgi:hypothetical protein
VSQGVAYQLRGLADAHFAHEARSVSFDGLGAYTELNGDLLGGKPIGDQVKHLAFSTRKK